MLMEGLRGSHPLSGLLDLPACEQRERGLEHTPREIAQQPETWRRTFDHLLAKEPELLHFLEGTGLRGPASTRPTVFLIGAGTSDYIGQSLFLLLQNLWQCTVIPVASTSLLPGFAEYVLPDRPCLWISFSRSGDSPEGVAVLERALAECPQVAHLLVSCNAAGRMHSILHGHPRSFSIVLDDAVNDRSLAMTSSFTNMLLAGQFLAYAWTPELFRPVVERLARAAEALLPPAAALARSLAEQSFPRVCFVGSGALAGAALESALKVLELTAGRVQTITQSTLALRHGPMAALDPETLFISLVSTQPQARRYDIDLLREIGSKGLAGTRVAVALTGDGGLESAAEAILTPGLGESGIPDLCRPLLDVLFGQLLGLFSSLHHGLKPDSPSPNGVISRVVANAGIY